MKKYRWAPTPSGPLHLGNLFSMLLTWLEARASSAQILLRIDDLDFFRARNEYVEDVFNVLNTLQWSWDEGPRSAQDFYKNFSQEHFQDFYQKEFDKALSLVPNLFFVCDCTRKTMQGLTHYSGRCRDRGLLFVADNTNSWRVRSGLLGSQELGDFVIYRKERLFAYQWVSLQDDLRYKVTDVFRGDDLIASTQAQQSLARFLAIKGLKDYQRFLEINFYHHGLLVRGNTKLSKSLGAEAAAAYLERPEIIYSTFAKWIGMPLSSKVTNVNELLKYYQEFKNSGGRVEIQKTSQLDELLGQGSQYT